MTRLLPLRTPSATTLPTGTIPSPRSRRIAALAIAALALAACGGEEPAAPEATGAETAAGEFNTADAEFAQGMIAHHEQAIAMAELALDPNAGARPEVVDLATRIRDAQDGEIELMKSWLTAWGQPLTMDTSDGHDMSEMEGMMSVEEMDALSAATGADFDRMWLEMMIEHHEGAITMASEVREAGTSAEADALAGEIIAAQQAEIEEMRALLG